MKILKGHASYVKGIAWDPVGTFLASQSDDKSIIIWRCSDWSPVQQIMEPFSEVLHYGSYPRTACSAKLMKSDSFRAIAQSRLSIESTAGS